MAFFIRNSTILHCVANNGKKANGKKSGYDCGDQDCAKWGNPNEDFQFFEAYRDKCCPKNGAGLDTPCCFITPPLTRISADEAFDAYQNQEIDGKTGVVMIDVSYNYAVSTML